MSAAGVATSANQLLHGYRDGHRLLAGSTAPSPAVLSLVDRLSDAAGPRPDPSIDGYLTCYPVPGGQYAIARTWYAWDAPRPNCVWTHTLLVDAIVLADFSLISSALGQLHPPKARSTDPLDYSKLLTLARADHLTVPLPNRIDTQEFRLALQVLYGDPPTSSWLSGQTQGDRDQIALAIWEQQWPSLRKGFSFCTGAQEPRRLDGGLLDLHVVPTAMRSAFAFLRQPVEADGEVLRIIQDLLKPDPAFRAFLDFAAAGTTSRRSMQGMVRLWQLLDDNLASGGVRSVSAAVSQLASKPDVMRRLKRVLLHYPGALLNGASPGEVLKELRIGALGTAVLCEDASLDVWVRMAWDEDPSVVLSLLGSEPLDGPRAQVSEAKTASQAMQTIIESVVLQQATLLDSRLISIKAPRLLGRLISIDRDWTSAVQHLSTSGFEAMLKAIEDGSGRIDPEVALSITRLLVSLGERGKKRWRNLAKEHPVLAVESLAKALSESPEQVLDWRETVKPYESELLGLLNESGDSESLLVVADLLSPSEILVGLGARPWSAVAREDLIRRLKSGVATLLIASMHEDSPAGRGLLAVTYSEAWSRLASNKDPIIWDLLCIWFGYPRDDWDRCRRLTQTVLNGIASRSQEFRTAFFSDVETLNSRAADQMRTLTRGKPKSLIEKLVESWLPW